MIAVSNLPPPTAPPSFLPVAAASLLLHAAALLPLALFEGPSADVQSLQQSPISVAFVIETSPAPEDEPQPESSPSPAPMPVVSAEPEPVPLPEKIIPSPTPPKSKRGPAPDRPARESPPSPASADVAEEAAFTPPRGEPAYLNNPPPFYPSVARRRGAEGTVLLSVKVGADGRAIDVRVRTSSGFSPLDAAALDAVRLWRFEPARRNGRPVAAEVEVPIRFRLNDMAQR